jgi:hypothetical protein
MGYKDLPNNQQMLKAIQDYHPTMSLPPALEMGGRARASIQSCPEKPSKHLRLFSVAFLRGCFVSFGVTRRGLTARGVKSAKPAVWG